ncbi:MAG: NDP-sugar synthase [Nitrospinota bacterium]
MKAMILAAGLGRRLRPLTDLLSKSMVPISNKPFLEYLIGYLEQAGFEELVINLHHHPNIIKDYFKDGSAFGVRINYSMEKEILGTAGGIKAAEPFLKDDLFFVINSDIAFKLDFADVIQFHKKNNALVTMIVREDKDVEKYGVIGIDSSCRVRRFLDLCDKLRTGTLKKTMFTGVALFDPSVLKEFPDKGYCDISKDIYPKLLTDDLPFFGYVTDKYWVDMGNPQKYLFLQKEIFSKKVFQNTVRDEQETNLQNRFSGARIVPPVSFGENVEIGKGSIIGPYASIGNNCIIHNGCTLNNSILWDNIIITENSKIENSIVCNQRSMIRV